MRTAFLALLAWLVSAAACAADVSSCDAEKDDTVRFACHLSAIMYAPDGYDFKGIKLGSPPSLIEKDPRFACEASKDTVLGDTVCLLRPDQRETIGSVPVRRLALHYYVDYLFLIDVEFSSAAFEQVLRTQSEQWGPPAARTTQTAKNRAGGTYENVTLRWRTPGASITMRRHTSDPETSDLVFALGKADLEYAKRKSPAAKNVASQVAPPAQPAAPAQSARPVQSAPPVQSTQSAQSAQCPVINGSYETMKRNAAGGTSQWPVTLSTRVEQGVFSYTVEEGVYSFSERAAAPFRAADGVARPFSDSRGRPRQHKLTCANGALTHESWMDEDKALTYTTDVYKVLNERQLHRQSNVAALTGTYTAVDTERAGFAPSWVSEGLSTPAPKVAAQRASPLEDTLAYLNARLDPPPNMKREVVEVKGGTLCRIWEFASGARASTCLDVNDVDLPGRQWRGGLIRLPCVRAECASSAMNYRDGRVERNPSEDALIFNFTRDLESVDGALTRLFGLIGTSAGPNRP